MPYVTVEKPRPHVSLITLNRPERLNALSFEVVEPLYAALHQVSADNDTWVAVLTGAGRGFCAGLDLEDEGIPPGIDGLPMSRIAIRAMHYFSDLVPTLRAMPQPVIAAINGPAIGGGMCLPLGADIRIAAQSAIFRAAGINNGITATELGISYLLPRLIGASRAWEMLLSGRDVDAAEAERAGIVSCVVPDEALLDTAFTMAARMCSYSPHGISMTKRVLWSSLEAGSLTNAIDLENRNQLLVRMTTQNFEEAVRARRERRKPTYLD